MTENMILADADYVDKVAFDLTVNFERMLERRIPQADMARWAECVALDGGLREGENEVSLVLVHDHRHDAMANFTPGNYANQLNGQAFKGPLGEFSITAISTEGLAAKDDLLLDTLRFALEQTDLKRLIVIPNEQQYNKVREVLRKAGADKRITLLAMQPMPGGHYQQEILGYSLMAALGIHAEEIKTDN